ncbi:ribosome maturation factor RimM [Calorimonas adulescens]|jgi:16S rRNA processing protein RimM|uniref:Ribosome maturation factor RimM n=1 Tax=Calorimonas adulescens TaxID=2606906 RepID=A0A5D8QGT2_9THEO|nr:ribosome maturation factor RimM [Calorimonas adulescens]TZE83374.1 16S rRNA processing protein RimM [Calorimonas adulescens]
MLDYLIIGKIVGTKGLAGEVKVYPMTQYLERFDDLEFVYVEFDGRKERYDIEHVSYSKKIVVIKFIGIDSIEAAQKLCGNYLYVDRAHAIKLTKDEYFLSDIIGLKVYDIDNNYLGIIKEIYTPGSNDVYEIVNQNGDTILIPAIANVIKEINLDGGYMIVELLEGLMG